MQRQNQTHFISKLLLPKTHTQKLSTIAILLSNIAILPHIAYANCPTPIAGSAVVQSGGICNYTGDNFKDKSRDNAVIDISKGGTATFTAPHVDLHKIRYGTSDGTYAAIFLRPEQDLTNTAIFEGDVTVHKATSSRYPRDIIIGGGNHLHIKGNLNISHAESVNGGSLFALNGDGDWGNARTDTSMIIEGNVIADTAGASFIRMGNGKYVFNKNVSLNSTGGTIKVFENTSGQLLFQGKTTIMNDKTFLYIPPTATPTIIFNQFTITNPNDNEIFTLGNGKTTMNGNSIFNTPNADAIRLYSNATFENNGQLSVTSKDGITIHAIPKENRTAIFNNLAQGTINTNKQIIVNDGAGTLVINNQGNLSSTAALFQNTQNGHIHVANSNILTGFLVSSNTDTLNLMNTGSWYNTANSRLDNLVNTGTITFISPSNDQPLILTTDNYSGGGTLIINSHWDNLGNTLNGISKTDVLKIKTIDGNAITTIKIHGNKIGNITAKNQQQFSTNVIEVENDHSGNLFIGTAETYGPYEAQLKRDGNNYHWTLQSLPNIEIINQPIVGYIQQPFINRQMIFSQLGKLHERISEQPHLLFDKNDINKRIWTRIRYDYDMFQGKKRFGTKTQSGFIQFGQDLMFKLSEEKTQQYTGITLTYGWAKNSFFDKYRAENAVVTSDKFTGSAKTDMLSLGSYHTYYSSTGLYIDTVGQISWLQNRYRSQNTQAKQNGYAFGTSIEIGKPFPLLNPNIAIEPQAQISYQSLWLTSFNDGIKTIQKNHQDSWITRIGTRVTWNNNKQNREPIFYISANLLKMLKGEKSQIKIDNQIASEHFSDLAVEFGLGGQLPLTQHLTLHANMHYILGIQDRNKVYRNSTLSRESYNGYLGIRYTW
ncbi:autotransporter outer membrane beta-barrel domain-containing protein [Pasteurella multocida]